MVWSRDDPHSFAQPGILII